MFLFSPSDPGRIVTELPKFPSRYGLNRLTTSCQAGMPGLMS